MDLQGKSNQFLLDRPLDYPISYVERIVRFINPRLSSLVKQRLVQIHDVSSYARELEQFIEELSSRDNDFKLVADNEFVYHILDLLQLLYDIAGPSICIDILDKLEACCNNLLSRFDDPACSNYLVIQFLKTSVSVHHGNICVKAGLFLDAEKYYSAAIRDRLAYFSDIPLLMLPLVSNKACMHLLEGNLTKADNAYGRIPENLRDEYGRESPYTINHLCQLSQVYRYIGRGDLSLRALEIACELSRLNSGTDKHLIVELHNEYGNALLDIGRYADAQESFEKALDQSKTLDDSEVVIRVKNKISNNLTTALWSQGLVEEANKLLSLNLLSTDNKLSGVNSTDLSGHNANRALLALELGKYDESTRIARQNAARAIKRIEDYQFWPDIANAYHGYAVSLQAIGQMGQAADMYCIALQFWIISGQIRSCLTTLNNLAFLVGPRSGKSILHFVLSMRNQYLEPEHPDISLSFGNLAYACYELNEPAQSHFFSCSALTREIQYIVRRYPLLPKRMRLEALRRLTDSQYHLYKLARLNSFAVASAYWARVNRHGILQSLEKTQMQLIKLAPGSENVMNELSGIYRELTLPSINPDRRLQLHERQICLEKLLYKSTPFYESGIVDPQLLLNAIPSSAILLEFVCIEKNGCHEYRVFSATQSLESLTFDYLCDAGELERLVARLLFSISNSLGDSTSLLLEISRVIFAPLSSRLNGISQLYLTLDGVLHQLPILALPYWQDSTKQLSDVFDLTILTSSRDLTTIHKNTKTAYQPIIVVSADFHDSSSRCLATNGNGSEAAQSTPGASAKPLDSIPYAEQEGNAIATILKAEQVSGSKVSANYLLSLRSPRILHLATHGIFNGRQACKDYVPSCDEPLGQGVFSGQDSVDSMLFSGLILSSGGDQEHEDYSFLSSLEATHLELTGTELVVLSACDTGLISVASGEGIYGLQRALIVAGTRSMLVSLWQVPDDATCAFMVRFYTLLKAGVGRLNALVQVQREFREHQNQLWRDPYYWAAWQLIGDWRPIEGL